MPGVGPFVHLGLGLQGREQDVSVALQGDHAVGQDGETFVEFVELLAHDVEFLGMMPAVDVGHGSPRCQGHGASRLRATGRED